MGGICDYVGVEVVFSIVGGKPGDKTLTAIFADPRYDSALDEGLSLDVSSPSLTAACGVFDGIERGDICTIKGKQYSVLHLDKDGHGGMKVILAYE